MVFRRNFLGERVAEFVMSHAQRHGAHAENIAEFTHALPEVKVPGRLSINQQWSDIE